MELSWKPVGRVENRSGRGPTLDGGRRRCRPPPSLSLSSVVFNPPIRCIAAADAADATPREKEGRGEISARWRMRPDNLKSNPE